MPPGASGQRAALRLPPTSTALRRWRDNARWCDGQFKEGAERSGGRWQRAGAARGFSRSAPLLIMDEPTAALDARAEYALFASIRKNAESRSVLVITHRLASV